MNDIKIEPSKRLNSTLSTWEVRDNRNKLVGTFDANKDKTRDKYDKLVAVAQVRNLQNNLFDIRESIKAIFHKYEEWQICDRAMQALSQTKMAHIELSEIIDHIKQS